MSICFYSDFCFPYLDSQVPWPVWLVNAVRSSANIVSQLDFLARKLKNRIDYNKVSLQVLRFSLLKRERLEQNSVIILVQQLHDTRQEVWHRVVMAEDWRAVAGVYLFPDLLGGCTARLDKPLGVVV